MDRRELLPTVAGKLAIPVGSPAQKILCPERKPIRPTAMNLSPRGNYLCVIINCCNDLHTIQILESSLYPSWKFLLPRYHSRQFSL